MTPTQLSFFQDYTPSGLVYLTEYLTGKQPEQLVAYVDATPWQTDFKRRVQHYGYRYDYKARRASKDDYLGPLPDWLAGIAEKLHRDGHFSAVPKQVIVNEYLPGQGIAAHIDCVLCFGEEIASISLLSGCTMQFAERNTTNIFDQYLEPNSLGSGLID